jgi:hypothetical protein
MKSHYWRRSLRVLFSKLWDIPPVIQPEWLVLNLPDVSTINTFCQPSCLCRNWSCANLGVHIGTVVHAWVFCVSTQR